MPTERRIAQVDGNGRGIERINRVVKITPQVLVGIQWARGANQCLRNLHRYANLSVHSRRPRHFWKRCPRYPWYNLSFWARRQTPISRRLSELTARMPLRRYWLRQEPERRHFSRNSKMGSVRFRVQTMGRRPLPSAAHVRPGAHSARHQDSHNDLTPCRMAWHFVSAGAHAPHSDQTLSPTPTPGVAHSARLASLCSSGERTFRRPLRYYLGPGR